MMINIDGFDLESQARNDCDLECEATKVEISDNVVVITDAMENGEHFYILLCMFRVGMILGHLP